MSNLNIQNQKILKENNLPSTFCVLGWLHTHIDFANKSNVCLFSCCKALGNKKNSLIEVENFEDLNESFNSEEYSTFRKQLLSGDPSQTPAACQRHCFNLEKKGYTSYRQRHNVQDLHLLDTANFLNLKKQKIIYLRLSIYDACNFKCRSCSPSLSTSINQEFIRHQDIYPSIKKSLQEANSSNITLKNLNISSNDQNNLIIKMIKNENFYKNLKILQITGGEPFLSPKTWDLLNFFIERKKTDIKFYFNTNCSKITHKGTSLLEIFKNFNPSNIVMLCSVDEIGPRAEIIRFGTKWSEVESNLILLSNSAYKPYICITVSAMNVERLPEIIEYFSEKKIINLKEPFIRFFIDTVAYPTWLSFNSIPPPLIFKIKNKLNNYINSYSSNQAIYNNLKSCLNNVISNLNSSSFNLQNLKEFKEETLMYDNIRKQNTLKTIPELIPFFEYEHSI